MARLGIDPVTSEACLLVIEHCVLCGMAAEPCSSNSPTKQEPASIQSATVASSETRSSKATSYHSFDSIRTNLCYFFTVFHHSVELFDCFGSRIVGFGAV